MIDKSKVKKTCVRPVNMTMSYEDRRGHVYVYVYVCMRLSEVWGTKKGKVKKVNHAVCANIKRGHAGVQ